MEKLVSPCCKSDYESSTDSACCTATLQMGLCSDCLEHSESEGYVCNTCEDWFDEPVEEEYACSFCGTKLESNTRFCSEGCYAAEFSEYT